jgi:hypothetical protein
MWRAQETLLARSVDYDLPALYDAPPESLAQLSRNTNQEVCFCSFLFRAWPVSGPSADLTFVADEQLAHILASVLRALVLDHPGYIFVQTCSRADRICRIGVVPARHSRTRWLLAFGSLVASAPAFSLSNPSTSLVYSCRFLSTLPRSRGVEPEDVPTALRFPLPSGAPAFLESLEEPPDDVLQSAGSGLGTSEDAFAFGDEPGDEYDLDCLA